MVLGMTHEEIMTWLAAREIRSYRQLPQMWYQLQTKLRDEARPKSGILRTREFIMKDSYSFDASYEGLIKSYELHARAYHRIFGRCGLKFHQVESDVGMMGGGAAHEFMAPSPAGEDEIVLCGNCGYGANVEVAGSALPDLPEGEAMPREDVHTPGKKTVGEVSGFLGKDPARFIKSLLVIAEKDNEPVLALVRGDTELHEKKLQKIIGPFRPATEEEIEKTLGVEAGFIGPQESPGKNRHKIRIITDNSLKTGSYISGANRKDYHSTGITAETDLDASRTSWHDIHTALAGHLCPRCGSVLRVERAIEIGNIFQLGTKYSAPLKANYLDENGLEKPLIMGSYGIGPARVAAAAIEQNYDKDGIIWPPSIAPFDVEIIPLSMENADVKTLAERLHGELNGAGIEALLDDRDERAGVKFKDADLIGIPVQLVIGERSLKEGLIELKERKTKETKRVPPEEALRELQDWKKQTA
jgi:prolyl-tRNA synthetase